MLIFVYGTLKRNHKRSCFLDGQNFIQEIKTNPVYCLYDAGGFPAMISGNLSVAGELWEVDNRCLNRLNKIEKVPYYYNLEKINIKYHKNVFAYIWQLDVENMLLVGSNWELNQLEN